MQEIFQNGKSPANIFSLYIHVPFCIQKCDYCSFFSIQGSPENHSLFLDRITDEIVDFSNVFDLKAIETVFIGGGNPTSIGTKNLEKLIKVLRRTLSFESIQEFTIETNPETFSSEFSQLLKSLPKLRLSLGVQRLNEGELKFLGRTADLGKIDRAMEIAFQVTKNISIDLILGIPGYPHVTKNLTNFLSRFPISHLSAYFLSLEENTPLEKRFRKNSLPHPSEIGPEELFSLKEILSKEGFLHYEISNFSKPQASCRHNLGYWLGKNYLGIGPSAVSTIGPYRFSQVSNFDDWLAGKPDALEVLENETRRKEAIMLRLRLIDEGLDLDWLEKTFGSFPPGFIGGIETEIAEQNIIEVGKRIKLTPKGLIFANRVISGLM